MKMTSAQIEEAQRLANEWMERKESKERGLYMTLFFKTTRYRRQAA